MSTRHRQLQRGRSILAAPDEQVTLTPTPRKSPGNLLSRLKGRRMYKNNDRSLSHEEVALSSPSVTSTRLKLRSNTSDTSRLLCRRRTSSVNTVMSDDSYLTANNNNTKTAGTELNVMQWLENKCPEDVLPKILAFAGPQTTAIFSKTNKHWNAIIKKEGTWRIMCEELYKWKKGDPEPNSWYDYYCKNPCVPVDYASIHKALSVALDERSLRRRSTVHQVRGVRVLVRPGRYFLKQAIDVRVVAGATVTIETMAVPTNVFCPSKHPKPAGIVESPHVEPVKVGKKSRGFRSFMSCVHQEEVVEASDTEDLSDVVEDWIDASEPVLKQAVLVLRSKRHNEPVFRVQQGVLALANIEVRHNSYGTDIWNGNAAIQIQPPIGDDDLPIIVEPRPTAILDRVQVSSKSGRGIVNIDGGDLNVRDSIIRDCAATGIYIGGPGSQALIARTDVIRNGIGNLNRRGVARGHSGIYVEQGLTHILDSNVSNNTLTGISAVSSDNAIITLEDSDLMSNGTFQLELPPVGTIARQQSITRNNTMQVNGEPRMRSGLTVSSESSSASPMITLLA